MVSMQQENLEGPDTWNLAMKKIVETPVPAMPWIKTKGIKKDKEEQVGATFPSWLAGSIWKPES